MKFVYIVTTLVFPVELLIKAQQTTGLLVTQHLETSIRYNHGGQSIQTVKIFYQFCSSQVNASFMTAADRLRIKFLRQVSNKRSVSFLILIFEFFDALKDNGRLRQ